AEYRWHEHRRQYRKGDEQRKVYGSQETLSLKVATLQSAAISLDPREQRERHPHHHRVEARQRLQGHLPGQMVVPQRFGAEQRTDQQLIDPGIDQGQSPLAHLKYPESEIAMQITPGK